ncbi:MAG: archaellin/type IV pilin N-terminal domain-containing protein [Candidatus Woesearchaeota archaeon]
MTGRRAGKSGRFISFTKGKIRLNKKAVSPLIATVLLIAFAVALGAVVMNWGRGYVDETTSFAKKKSDTEISCSMDIGMKFIKFNDKKDICIDNGTDTINFTLQNTGTVPVVGVKIQAIGNSSVVEQNINESIPIAGIHKGYIDYSLSGNGSLRQTRFTPMIKVEGSKMLCAQNALIEEDVSICTG